MNLSSNEKEKTQHSQLDSALNDQLTSSNPSLAPLLFPTNLGDHNLDSVQIIHHNKGGANSK